MKVRSIQALVVMLMLAAGCGEKITRDLILTRTMAGMQAAQAAFVEYDARKQADLVAAAASLEAGKAALADWRGKRDKVALGFVGVYSAIAVASLDLTDAAIGHVVQLAAEVIAALKELGVLPGGVR